MLNRQKTVRMATTNVVTSGKVAIPNNAIVIAIKNLGTNRVFVNGFPFDHGDLILLGGVGYDFIEQDNNEWEAEFIPADVSPSSDLYFFYKVELDTKHRPCSLPPEDNEV